MKNNPTSYMELGNKYNLLFKSPEKINNFFNEYQKQELDIAKEQGINSIGGLAELRYGNQYENTNDSIYKYLLDNQSIQEFSRNNIEVENAKLEGYWASDITNNTEILKNMNTSDRYDEFNNYEEGRKNRLSLLGIDTQQEFNDTIDLIQKYDRFENTIGTDQEEESKLDLLGGTIAGAVVGGIIGVALAPFTGGLSLAAIGKGAAIGAGISAGVEVGAEVTDSELLEGVRNLKRNFQNATLNSTVGMTGRAINTLGNVADVIAYNIAGEDFSNTVSEYNPFHLLGGTLKGTSNYLVEDPTRQYSGISKFLLQDIAGVAGSITGFMAMGQLFSTMTGGGAIGAKGATAEVGASITAAGKTTNLLKGALGFSKGTTYGELATRTMVALGEMDEVYEDILEETGDMNKAFSGSLVTGGINWAVLSATKAIPGERLKMAATQRYANLNGTANIVMGLGKEMLSEGFEEIGQLFATELGKYVGTGSAEFSDLKTYGETAYLGALGGLMGGGMQYAGTKKQVISDVYQQLENQTNPQLIKDKYNEFYNESENNKIEAMDKVNEWAFENELPGTHQIVVNTIKSNLSEGLIDGSQKTIDKLKSYETESIQTLDKLGIDKTEGNLGKAMLLISTSDATQDMDLKTEIRDNLDLYLRADQKYMETIGKLDAETKARLNQETNTTKINQQLDAIDTKMFKSHEVFNDIKSIENKTMTIQEYMNKHDLSYRDMQNMYRINATDQKENAILDTAYQEAKQDMTNKVSSTLRNKSKTNIDSFKSYMKDNNLTLDGMLEGGIINESEYLQLAQALGEDVNGDLNQLSNTAENLNDIIKIQEDLSAMEMADELTYQEVKQNLNKITEIEKALKSEYGNLNNVPFDTLKELGIIQGDITPEGIKELKQTLREAQRELRKEPKMVKPQEELKQTQPVTEIKKSTDYYKNKVNQTVAKLDIMRSEYYQALDNEVTSLKEIDNVLKDKYNLTDIKDYIAKEMQAVNGVQPQITDLLGKQDIKAVGVDYDRITGKADLTTYYDGEFYDNAQHEYIFDRYDIVDQLLESNKNKSLEDGKVC